MKKSSRVRREQPQLNTERTPEPGKDYSLEEILEEFGGWTKRDEPAAPEPAPEEPLPDEPDGEAPAEAVPTETVPTEPPPQEATAIWSYKAVRQEAAKQSPELPKMPERAERPTRQEPKGAQKETPPPRPAGPSAEALYKGYCARTRGLVIRRRILAFLCLLALAVTTLCHFAVPLGSFVLTARPAFRILVGLLLAGALAAFDILLEGVYRLLRLRPTPDSLLAVAAVVFAADGFLHLRTDAPLPYTAVLLLGLYFACWGRLLKNRTCRRGLKAALALGPQPRAAVVVREAWNGNNCVFRAQGDREQLAADLETPSIVERVMAVYAPAVIALSVVLAALMRFLQQRDFLACWTAMLAGSIPLTGFLAYWKPMWSASGRLLRAGAVLCGWSGARELSTANCVTVEDGDLFSRANVSMNGMKVFGEHSVSQVVGYTYSIIADSGSGLKEPFREVFVNQNGREYKLDSFRRYEGGGLGAEILGDVVLVGSIGFMQLMGVRMPEGTNLRQAVYCAVNQELAAVFAIYYNPSAAVRSGLQTVLQGKELTLLLATRDFILTPAVVRHKYKVPSDALEYPAAEERARLSAPEAAAGGRQGAILARDSFLPLAEAVSSGRNLCASVRTLLAIALLCGVVGFAITAVLAWAGGLAAASAFNVTLYVLLCALLALIPAPLAGRAK